MKKALFVGVFVVLLAGCGGVDDDGDIYDNHGDGSRTNTYSSCKITESGSLLAKDQARDLAQCWNFRDPGIKSKTEALRLCKSRVQRYYADTYPILGNATGGAFAVESTYCP